MGAAAGDVLGIEAPVEPDRGVDRLHDRVRPGGETPAPHRVRTCLGHGDPVMKLFGLGLLYTALLVGAIGARADVPALEALREGTMRKLVFAEAPQPVSAVPFT